MYKLVSKRTVAALLSLILALSFASCTPSTPAPAPAPAQTAAPAPAETPAPAPESALKPGVYTATANGHNGPITVEVTFDETSIVDVQITEQYETAGVQQAVSVFPQKVVEHQSVGIDTVAGATFGTRAILMAVSDCIEQAGGNVDDFSSKPAEQAPAQTEYTADVIVVGAGGAGLAAAVSAHQNGSTVLVVEKLGIIGGSTVFSGGAFNAADPDRQSAIEMTDSNRKSLNDLLSLTPHDDFEKELQATVKKQYDEHVKSGNTGLFDSPELHMLQTYNGGDYLGQPALIRVLAENAFAATQSVEELGAIITDKIGMATGAIWQRSHYGNEAYPDGFHSVFPAANYIDTHDNVDIHLNTKASSLIVEGGKVVGVKATSGSHEITYKANKGVVMATGGFGANVEMREKYNTQWKTLDKSIGCSNQSVAAQGDGIIMGEAAGAQLIDMGLIQLHPNGEPGTGMMMGVPPTSGLNRIFVNNEGNRFVAEDARRDTMINAMYAAPGGTMWVVADGTRYPEGEDLEMVNSVKLGKTLQAPTIPELASLMGVDAGNLQKAFDDYNAIVDGATDPLGLTTYGKKMDNAPYYAAKRLPTVHHTMGGLKIDTEARVLDANDKPIPGFYAAGEVTGGIHGGNRLGGNAITDINVYGRIAGKNAAEGK